MILKKAAAIAVLGAGLSLPAQAALVDIAFIVDQSFSMRPEFRWIPDVIGEIDTALAGEDAVDGTRYGVVGYMESPMMRDSGTPLVYQDLSSDIADTVAAVTDVTLYGVVEAGYEAAYWSKTGFSWSDDAVKIMILLTDEAADQRSELGPDAPPWGGNGLSDPDREAREVWLGEDLDDDGFLLNVVAPASRLAEWESAVYDIEDPTYTGFFDIGFLRDDPEAFTSTFVAAKVAEIIDEIPDDDDDDDDDGGPVDVPEPGALLLIGTGLLGLGLRRRRQR